MNKKMELNIKHYGLMSMIFLITFGYNLHRLLFAINERDILFSLLFLLVSMMGIFVTAKGIQLIFSRDYNKEIVHASHDEKNEDG